MDLAIPKKFEHSCLKKKLVWLEDKWIWFIITEDFFLIECFNQIINFVSLKSYDDDNKLIKNGKSNNAELSVVHTTSDVICIVTINNALFVFKRFACHFDLILKDNNVVDFRLQGKINSSDIERENSTILITYKSGETKKIYLGEYCKREADFARNQEIQKHLHKERIRLVNSIRKVQKERMIKYHKLLENQKFVSKFARSCSDPEELQPLCRFGSIFTRTCNEKLVIGIPVFNQAQG